MNHLEDCRAGDSRKLEYGVDSYGNLCGADNTRRGGPDLSGAKNLLYLDALELLSPTNYLAAKSICVATCPGAESLCDITSLPCRNNTQYRCVNWVKQPFFVCRKPHNVDCMDVGLN